MALLKLNKEYIKKIIV